MLAPEEVLKSAGAATVASVRRARVRRAVDGRGDGGVDTGVYRTVGGGVGSAVVTGVRIRAPLRVAVRIGARPIRRAAVGLRAGGQLAMESGIALVLEDEGVATIALLPADFAPAPKSDERGDDGAEGEEARERGTVIRAG